MWMAAGAAGCALTRLPGAANRCRSSPFPVRRSPETIAPETNRLVPRLFLAWSTCLPRMRELHHLLSAILILHHQ